MGIEYIEQESVVPPHGVAFIVTGLAVGLGIMGALVMMARDMMSALIGA